MRAPSQPAPPTRSEPFQTYPSLSRAVFSTLAPARPAPDAAKEKIVGWYSTGPKIRTNDVDIHELFTDYHPNPAFVIAALGKQMHTVLDVTIVYPGARPPGFWALVSGQVPHVIVDIHECELPEALLEGDYSGDPHYREHFQRWVSDLWQRKDQRIDQLRIDHNKLHDD